MSIYRAGGPPYRITPRPAGCGNRQKKKPDSIRVMLLEKSAIGLPAHRRKRCYPLQGCYKRLNKEEARRLRRGGEMQKSHRARSWHKHTYPLWAGYKRPKIHKKV